MMKNRMRKPAFTFVEMVLVITIIGLMASLVVLDFGKAQKEQEVAVLAGESVALLQQARAEISAGRTFEGQLLCEGAYLQVGGLPQFASAYYDAESGDCVEEIAKSYGFSAGSANIKDVSIGGISVDNIFVFFIPPNAGVYYGGDYGEYDDDLVLTLGQETGEEKSVILNKDLGTLSTEKSDNVE